MRVRTWILIGFAAFVMLVMSCAVMVGSATYVLAKRVHIDMHASEPHAAAQMQAVIDRFDGGPPLIGSHDDATVVHEELRKRAATFAGPPPESLHVMVWNRSDEKLVQFHLPFWLLRLKPVGRLDLDAGDFQLRRFRVSAEDLQRAGPLLVIDLEENSKRLIVWTE